MRKFHRLEFWSIALAFYIPVLLSHVWAQEVNRTHPEKTMTAIRVNPKPPKIDGFLDDEVWQHAPIATDFVQSDPTEGVPATEKTTVQVTYDDEALYIGIMCYDSEPDKIISRIGRRDEWVETDFVSVNLDPHHDHQTGYFFTVGPSGWIADGTLYNDTSRDRTWDGVWEAKTAKTSIHDQGWSAEYKIPYHVLRFSPKDEYTWGININRRILRKQESAYWILVPKKDNGWVSRFGHLEGIKGIKPPLHLEMLPFAVGRSTFQTIGSTDPDGRELLSSAGLDLRYALASNVSLNATINPDFGQVEADPAVLNLTVFETFFEERRPFFIEGNAIFRIPQPEIMGIDSPPQLFYSRRIGKQPGLFLTPKGSTVRDQPNATTILGAAKLSGKTANKTSFSIVEAVTANEYTTIERTFIDPITGLKQVKPEKYRIEPLTNFFVGRIQQDVLDNSTIGMILTSVNREGAMPAYAAGVDGNLRWNKSAYSLFLRLVGSRMGSLHDRKNGYGALAHFSKFSGWLGGQIYLDAYSPGFNVNNLGFMNRANRIQSGASFYANRQTPWILARRSGFKVGLWSHWNYDGINLLKGGNFESWHELKNYWFFHFGISREFDSLDDLETRGGPLIIRPAKSWYWLNLQTDNRKSISLNFILGGSRTNRGPSFSHGFGVQATFRPASNVQLKIGPSYQSRFQFAQWVTNVDDEEDGKYDHYVFGELKTRILDFTTRTNVSFTPNLSLQLYLQPFVAIGDFSNFKELARPRSYELSPYSKLNFNPDFSRRSLRSNLVFRWEYGPGSTLFVVWSQSRIASFDDPSLRLWESMIRSFSDEGQNIFLVKLNYWLGL